MQRKFFIIAHNHHRNFRARANLCDLVHGFQGGNGGLVVNRNNDVVGADPCLGGRAFRRNIIHHDPLQLIDPAALRMQRRNFAAADPYIAANNAAIADQLIHNLGCQLEGDRKADALRRFAVVAFIK